MLTKSLDSFQILFNDSHLSYKGEFNLFLRKQEKTRKEKLIDLDDLNRKASRRGWKSWSNVIEEKDEEEKEKQEDIEGRREHFFLWTVEHRGYSICKYN